MSFLNTNMKEIKYTLSLINLNISINRLRFRAKLSDISDEKKKVIADEANDLESVLETLKMLKRENDEYYSVINSLSLEIMRLKKEPEKEFEI